MTLRETLKNVVFGIVNKVLDLTDIVHEKMHGKPKDPFEDFEPIIGSPSMEIKPDKDEIAELSRALESGYAISGYKPVSKAPEVIDGYNHSWIRAALLHMFLNGKATVRDIVAYESTKMAAPIVHQAIYELNNGLADRIEAIILDRKDPSTVFFSEAKPNDKILTLQDLRAQIIGWNPTDQQLEELNSIKRRPRSENPIYKRDRWASKLSGWGTLDFSPERIRARLIEQQKKAAEEGVTALEHEQRLLEELKEITDNALTGQLFKIKMLQQEIEAHRAAAERLESEPVGETDKPEEPTVTGEESQVEE